MTPRPILLLAAALLSLATADAAERPNIVFILTDDQSPFTLKTYGNEVCQTPNLDRISAEGMTFDGAYHMGSWSGAVCTPSRHMIMSGRTVWHIPGAAGKVGKKKKPGDAKTKRVDPGLIPQDLAEQTMAAVFNRAGYDTMRTCKTGNTYHAANKQFDTDASKQGCTAVEGSAWHGDQAMKFLEEREKTGDQDPFLMYFGFTHPHDPRNGTDELLKKYGAVNKGELTKPNPAAPPLQVNYLPAHPFHHGHPGLRDEEKVQGVLLRRDEATIRNELGREYACIENIDRQIGRVLKQLEKTGELDNTYIFFTSDHGIAVGRHGLTGKQNLYEHTWRVPYLVKGPGIAAGSRAQGNIYLLDTLATLCDLAGVDAPKTVEGTSFRPVLEGKKKAVRDVLYGVYCGGTKPGMRSVKKGKWKLIKYDVLDGKVRETQLFNLEENPNEFLAEHAAPKVSAMTGSKPKPGQVNLAEDPDHQAIRKEMEALLIEQMQAHNDPYRLWDQPQK